MCHVGNTVDQKTNKPLMVFVDYLRRCEFLLFMIE